MTVCGAPVAALAQEESQVAPDVVNAQHSIVGVINASAVNVRSGPGDNYYPVMQLDKGAQVTVVGKRFNWLKILPPEGSFCYVAKVYVKRQGDGSVGIVDRPDLNVRAGSMLNQMKTIVLTQLDAGAEVQILGEQDEYFKIKPPTGAYFYVSAEYVEPVKPADEQAADAAPTTEPAAADAEASANQDGTATPAAPADATAPETATGEATAVQQTPEPTTAQQPARAEAPVAASTAAEDFDRLEAQFKQVVTKPVLDTPVEELLAGYRDLAKNERLYESMRRIVETRIKVLEARADARAQFASVKQSQEQLAEGRKNLTAEREELQERIKTSDVQVFAAVGQLQASSLQVGVPTLYRLTDPGTGRTLVYVRSGDQKLANLVGRFVGLRGDVVNDTRYNMKVITPTEFEPVDPAQVHKRVAAPITPPSLLQQNIPAAPAPATTNP